MRIPFPERITPWHAGAFAALICAFELLLGTQPLFCACVFIYIMLATVAFNLAGGLYRAAGAFVFANAVLSLIFCQIAKVCVGEAADANLRAPMTSILVYTGGMASILVAVVVSRKLVAKVPLLDRGRQNENTRQTAIGCIAVGIGMPFLVSAIGADPGSIGTILNQFGQFLPLGLVLATYDEIRSSHGRRSANLALIIGSLYMVFIGGILGTSKQGLFTPFASYVVVLGALRYKLNYKGILSIALVTWIMLYYLVPYAQVVRNYTRDLPTFDEHWDASIYWLNHLDDIRAEYNANDQDIELNSGPHYYSKDRGFLERLGALAMDDALIDTTDIHGAYGFQPLIVGIENVVPHFIWKNKPVYLYNNSYAHEIGILGEEDFTTSISFGPSADGYHQAKWIGVLVVMPLVLIVLFTIVDSVAGSIKHSPWGLIFTVYFLHAGAESTLGSCFTSAFIVSITIVITVYAARYVLPLVGSVLFPERRKTILVRSLQPVPATHTALPPDTTIEHL